VRECRRNMSRPYDRPTPYHPVILAQARIHKYSDAALDSCLRRNDGAVAGTECNTVTGLRQEPHDT